jgi:hypothetical protein
MLHARRLVATLAIVFAACASSSNTGLAVSVTELREPGIRTPAVGEHYYRIRVTNRSDEGIVVESIHIQPSSSDFDIEDATEPFGDSIGPEETRAFDMSMRVRPNRAVQSGFIDSVRVLIEARNEKGSFSDSGDYWVGAERP